MYSSYNTHELQVTIYSFFSLKSHNSVILHQTLKNGSYMLSYQHGYHAGNFADVLKHCGLTHLLHYLTQKEKPLFYLETHSGRGLYDLNNHQALKTNEFKQGIQLLWEQKQKLPPAFAEYIKTLKRQNTDGVLRHYPGSPFIATQFLRNIDRVYCCELHPTEYEHLLNMPQSHKKIHFSHSDGMDALTSLVPPPEKRGLIFIDPSYEVKEEYKTIPQTISQALNKFSNGVYCLWYPVLDQRMNEQLHRRLDAIGAKNSVRIEFNLTKKPMQGMYGCGLWLVNAPYTFADTMHQVCTTLKQYFNPNESSYFITTSK